MLPRTDSPGLGLGLSLIGQLSERLDISHNGACRTEVRMSFAEPAGVDRIRSCAWRRRRARNRRLASGARALWRRATGVGTPRPVPGWVLGLAAAYYAAAKFGYKLEFAGPVAAIVW